MTLRIGADVGGTFTDFFLADAEREEFHALKVPTTQPDPSAGLIEGLVHLLERYPSNGRQISFFAHGTTLATNMLLEGKGARTALVTTKGFRDLLELRREKRPDLYDIYADKPKPLVERQLRFEVLERILWDGTILSHVAHDHIQQIVDRIRELPIEAVAVMFLHSYMNPANEQAVKRRLAEALSGVYVSASHEVANEFREFERLSTTAINASLGPAMLRYLESFARRLEEIKLRASAFILKSDAGIVPLAPQAIHPVELIASGPSAGVAGAVHTAQRTGIGDIITLDMGGTSTDVSVVEQGQPKLTSERDLAGWPLKVPAVDIVSVGAGGGSLATVDTGGLLKVGPESASSAPGPAAYAKGGLLPTVTDAHVVLGWLDPSDPLGGSIVLHPRLSQEAITNYVAGPLRLDLQEAAEGILTVAVARMVHAIRLVSVKRGYDPRKFTLVAFGGNGPLHAGYIMRELGMSKALIPLHPGVMSGLGTLTCNIRLSFRKTHIMKATENNRPAVAEVLGHLADAVFQRSSAVGLKVSQDNFQYHIDARYVGQNYELTVPVKDPTHTAAIDSIVHDFHREHERAYGYAFPDAEVECVTMRATANLPPPPLSIKKRDWKSCSTQSPRSRSVYFLREGVIETPIYSRESLAPGTSLRGPAIIEQMDSTTLVLGGQEVEVDDWGDIHLSES